MLFGDSDKHVERWLNEEGKFSNIKIGENISL